MKNCVPPTSRAWATALVGFLSLLKGGPCEAQSSNPKGPKGGIIEWAAQGWGPAERDLYHYTSQGTVLAPLDWFRSLERPGQAPGMFSDPEYLEGFGFIYESASPRNPFGLPVGLAVAPPGAPAAGTVGLNCAACHTGELRYQGRRLRIAGGQSMLNTGTFGGALAAAMIQTYEDPNRWERFAIRVLGEGAGESEREEFRKKFGARVARLQWTAQVMEDRGILVTEEGFGRNDAIGRIGNNTFGNDLLEPDNFHVVNAPVSYPQLWDIWKFDWVQYDASVVQPMARNVGEALGVGAVTSFLDPQGNPVPEPAKWNTSIDIHGLYSIEQVLQSLKAPSWPSQILGRVDRRLAEEGRKLFTENCSSCHAPRPVAPPYHRFAQWAVTTVPVELIGTDATRAVNSWSASFDPSKLGLAGVPNPVSLKAGLDLVTERVKDYSYDAAMFSSGERAEYDGFGRPNLTRFELIYKARPLDGVWATAPYLHNGSVRNIYDLLSPVADRARKFWVGSNDFDPARLGLGDVPAGGFAFEMDVEKPGNGNGGHEFADHGGPGVIGRQLNHGEKMAIIEYLKVLDQMPPRPLRAVPLDWEEYGWNP